MFLANNLNKGGSLGGYQISRSLRFNSADSAYLNRTPASATNRKTWTWSGWVKRSTLGYKNLFGCADTVGSTNNQLFQFAFDANDKLYLFQYNPSTTQLELISNAVYRDVSAWYHLVLAYDTTQATASNRIQVYVNNQAVTFTGSGYPTQNIDGYINTAIPHLLGRYSGAGPTLYLDAYMTEVNFIDGQALTPSSFGETNAQTGVWQPKAYSGSYGTNGFYLNFSDNSNTTAATLGKDYSGNGNNWTPNNFSVTAGAGNDSIVDSPTSYGTDTGVGGTVRGNYATLNPLLGSTATLSNGNLNMVVGTTATKVLATIGMSSGKWYWEYSYTDISGDGICGIATAQASITAHVGLDAYSWGYVAGTGNKVTNSSSSAYGSSYTTGDVIGVAFDADAGTLVFYKNGTSQGTAYSSLTSGPYFPAFGDNAAGSSSTLWANFGQRPFAYTAPSGFKALCTQNLPTPTIGATTATQASQFFAPVIYSGDGTTGRSIAVGFQPDFTWIKTRTPADWHVLDDSVRGAGKILASNSTQAEVTDTTAFNAFNSNGFVVGTSAGWHTNRTGGTYVAWNWRASNATAVTNTSGSITSTVSANTTSGFSVVTYTATGSVATIGHGLGVAPSMVILKGRSGTTDWFVYHSAIGATKGIYLNQTGAEITSANFWNNTAPTSTVFTAGTGVGGSGVTEVAYCFAEVAGYSKFGSYTGNGSADGPFVFTGFRPAYVMVKPSSAAGSWWINDNKRDTYNVNDHRINANTSDAEATAGFTQQDFLSNGFKWRNSDSAWNGSGVTYIYMAFAENPFKYSLAR